jgi:asparagine synthase (glutamine-hydrolysing)
LFSWNQAGKRQPYWDFDATKRIHYRSDREYEEHFRDVFMEAVRRRLRSDSPVIAELSGGMDSSSIVCVADHLIEHRNSVFPRLYTLSYYNDTEPNWNERPYFTKVEKKRGQVGCHIDLSSQDLFTFEVQTQRFAATPGSLGCIDEKARQFSASLMSQAIRTVLSGIGGDEVMGGVPTPSPELGDLLVRGRFKTLSHQLKIWALDKRRTWFHLLFDAVREFFPPAFMGGPKDKRLPRWLDSDFVEHHRVALAGYESRLKVFTSRPSFQENLRTIEGLRRQLTCFHLPSDPIHEKRYPYLDRDLLEFIFAVPREQLVRPGQRRSLMRRALGGLVPNEILTRKRKAFVSRTPRVAFLRRQESLLEMSQDMVGSSLGIIDSRAFRGAITAVCHDQEVPVTLLVRTVLLERWLQHAIASNVLKDFHQPSVHAAYATGASRTCAASNGP